MRIASCTTTATDSLSQSIILIASPLQQWLHERAQVLRYTYIACLVQQYFFPPGATQPIVGAYFTALRRALASSCTRLLDHTQ
jgi:hypothetical protein